MNYLEVYYSRLNHLGETTGERITNGGIRTFQRWKAESPHTVTTLSVERGLYFDGIILQSKDKAYQKILHLNVANDIPIRVGDIMNWIQLDGTLEKWILLSEEKKVNGTYRTFDILKCNYLIKWINDKGYLKQSWAYVLSSTDDKVKGNFRTWHNLITPQPNKYAEIIMPRPIDENSQVINTVDRGTNFIIEDESWKMVEADFTSVQGIIYMSLTENKVNMEYDDLEVDVADTDKLIFPTLQKVYTVGQEIIPEFNEQTLNEWEIVLTPPEDQQVVILLDNGHLRANQPGQVIVKMRLKNYDINNPRRAVVKEFEITVNEEGEALYIKGPDTIRLDRYSTYVLANEDIISTDVEPEANIIKSDVSFTLTNLTEEIIPLGTLEKVYDDNGVELKYTKAIHANNKNKLGQVLLEAEYNNKTYSKVIKIIPLW